MAGAKIEYHVRMSLTFKAYADASTYVVWLTTIPFSSTVPTTFYYPLLVKLPDFGVRMGEHLPEPIASSFTVDNSPGSFGYQRRLSDLFERYTIVGQQVRMQVAYGAIGEVVDGDFADVWYGTITRARETNDLITFEVAGQGIRNRVITKIVTSTDFPSAPQASLGQALPIVFGSSVEVRPIRIAADGNNDPEWAYATTLGTTYPTGGVQQYYAKDKDGKYQAVASAGATSTVLFGRAPVAGQTPVGFGSNSVKAKEIVTTTNGYIITHAKLRIYKTAGAENGEYHFEIRKNDQPQNSTPAAAPGTTIGAAQYEMSGLSAAAGEYDLEVAFSSPVVIPPNSTYYLVMWFVSSTGDCFTSKVQDYVETIGGLENTYKTIYTSQSTGRWFQVTATTEAYKSYWSLYGAVLADAPSSAANSEGLGHAYFEVSQRAAPSGYTNADLTKLDFIVATQGLKDSSTGTVTGTNDLLIESPQYAAELMTKEWNGSAWTTGQYSDANNSGSHSQVNTSTSSYYRKLNGRTSGRTRLTDFLEDICRNTACRMTMNTSAATPLGLWAWGATEGEDSVINDEDAIVTDYELLGSETVVNDVEIYYSDILKNIDVVTGSAQGEFKNFAGYLHYYSGLSSFYTTLCSKSYGAYGTRKNQNVTFPWIGDSDSGQAVAQYLVRKYPFPHQYVDIEVPFWKYKALALMDVARMCLPRLPAFFGTASKSALPSYAGTSVKLLEGHYWKRAAHYRAQVESFQVVFDSEQVPKLRLGMRLLTSTTDPT